MRKSKKKYDPVRAQQNRVALVVGGVLSRMYLWGSSTVPMRTYGTANLGALLDPQGRRMAQAALFEILQQPRTWRFWTMIVADIGHGRVEVVSYKAIMEESMMSDFTEHLDATTRGTYKGAGEIVAYAYLAAPNDDIDFDLTEDPLMDYWLERGLAEEKALPEQGIKPSVLDFAKSMLDVRLSMAMPLKPQGKNVTPELVN